MKFPDSLTEMVRYEISSSWLAAFPMSDRMREALASYYVRRAERKLRNYRNMQAWKKRLGR